VQRALEAGEKTTGVSVAYTVLDMDAGPVLAAEELAVPPDATAPELLDTLFASGTRLLMARLPEALDGRARLLARPQDAAAASQAPKISQEESLLDFSEAAEQLHNKVRAFAGWPGTRGAFRLVAGDGSEEEVELKIVETRVGTEPLDPDHSAARVQLKKKPARLLVACGGGGVLEVRQLQPPTKKAMDPQSYFNGLRGRRLVLPP